MLSFSSLSKVDFLGNVLLRSRSTGAESSSMNYKRNKFIHINTESQRKYIKTENFLFHKSISIKIKIYLLFFMSFQKSIDRIYFYSRYSFWSSQQICSLKKLFLKISQGSYENTYARVPFLIKLKKRLWHMCFLVIFCEIFKNSFFSEHVLEV